MSPANSAAIAMIWQSDFDALVRQAKGKLRSTEAAEDTVMQAFAKLGELMERRFLPNPRKLLGVILHGLLVDIARTARPTVSYEEHAAEQDNIGARVPYLAVDNAAFPADFDRAVRDLDDDERDVYILTELRGLTKDEAADVLGISRRTAYRRHASALTSIRKELAA